MRINITYGPREIYYPFFILTRTMSRDPIALFHKPHCTYKYQAKQKMGNFWNTRLDNKKSQCFIPLYYSIPAHIYPSSANPLRRNEERSQRSLWKDRSSYPPPLLLLLPHFFVLILQRPFSTRRMFPTSMESVNSSARDAF